MKPETRVFLLSLALFAVTALGLSSGAVAQTVGPFTAFPSGDVTV